MDVRSVPHKVEASDMRGSLLGHTNNELMSLGLMNGDEERMVIRILLALV